MELFFFWIGIAIACGVIGASKGRSAFGWILLGGLFSVIALIIVACLPSRRAIVVHSGPIATPDTHVKCPDCAELVLREAKMCKHCRCRLVPQLA